MNSFRSDGYAYVESAIPLSLARIAEQYTLFDEKQNFNAEGVFDQVPGAHSKYADPLMESLLIHLLPKVEEASGLSLAPTYSYYRLYRPGSSLPPHTDRESCEISATLCLGYSYNEEYAGWPIYVEDKKIMMNPGDMLIYHGCTMNHYRDVFTASYNSYHSQAFLHYVDFNGPYASFARDQRSSLGEKRVNIFEDLRRR